MYQSLYRTWRPKTFTDMVGQENVVRALRYQAAQGHIAHAYLFSGSRGTGKTSTARILSMAINCKNPKGGDPCLECEACQSLLSDTTLDVVEMDAASNSGVSEIRDMLEKVSYPPQFVRYKVYIIDEVHMLSNAAFNALLKTLEEPPDYMVFILATTELQKIPATILSRCQRFDFGRIAVKDIIGRLRVAIREGAAAEEEALNLIADSAEGSMRDAWSLMDMCLDETGSLTEERVRQTLGIVTKGFLFDFVDALHGKDSETAFRMIDQLHSAGKDIQVFLKSLSAHLRLLLGAKLSGGADGKYKEQAERIPIEKLTWMLERAIRAEGDLRWTSQQRAVLEVYALSICLISEEKEPLALAARLQEVESRLAGGAAQAPAANPSKPSRQAAPLKEKTVKKEATPPASEQEDGPWLEEPPQEEDDLPPVPEAAPVAEPTPPEAPSQEAAPESGAHPEEPSVTAAAATTGPGSPKEVWNTALERASKQLPNVYSIIREGKYGGFKDGCYYLSYTAEKQFYIGFMMAEDRRRQLELLLSETGGVPARFEAVKEQDAAKEKDAKEKARRDIKALSDVFGRQNITVTGLDDVR